MKTHPNGEQILNAKTHPTGDKIMNASQTTQLPSQATSQEAPTFIEQLQHAAAVTGNHTRSLNFETQFGTRSCRHRHPYNKARRRENNYYLGIYNHKEENSHHVIRITIKWRTERSHDNDFNMEDMKYNRDGGRQWEDDIIYCQHRQSQ